MKLRQFEIRERVRKLGRITTTRGLQLFHIHLLNIAHTRKVNAYIVIAHLLVRFLSNNRCSA